MRIATCVFLASVLGAGATAGQERTITGRVLPSEAGVPWAGAALFVPGSDAPICVQPDGRFSVLVPEGESRLILKPIGFPATEITLTPADDEMLLPLAVHVVHLEGVVVTGFATTFSNSAEGGFEMKGSELTRAPGDVSSGLTARVPGATVAQNSAAPGSSQQVQIRGINTILGATQPLVVVDGVPVSDVTVGSGSSFITGSRSDEEVRSGRLDELNPHDIERVEVLKGLAATQRFGPRAANGVLSITTRRGAVAETPVRSDPALPCYRPPM